MIENDWTHWKEWLFYGIFAILGGATVALRKELKAYEKLGQSKYKFQLWLFVLTCIITAAIGWLLMIVLSPKLGNSTGPTIALLAIVVKGNFDSFVLWMLKKFLDIEKFNTDLD